MVGVDEIVRALAVGASAGLSDTANAAVRDGYAALKDLIRARFADRDEARQAMDADETEPAVWLARIGPDLVASGAGEDQAIVDVARKLISTVITVTTNNGVVTGSGKNKVNIHNWAAPHPPTKPAAG